MKSLQINVTAETGSTGKICTALGEILDKYGVENYILYTGKRRGINGKKICYMTNLEAKRNALLSRIFGNYGFNTKRETKRLIVFLEKTRPDIVHLHNLHGHNCNLKLLFEYLKTNQIRVLWTFHDCWAFTGYCPHYDMINCQKWKAKCNQCPQANRFSYLLDRSGCLHAKKKALFSGLNMTVVTPSQWLADQMKQSFLGSYPVKVINNGIDLNIFKPTASDLRQSWDCENKVILLGVAHDWSVRKGLDVFARLAERLNDHFQIVLVGVNKKIKRIFPQNVICIERTKDQLELARIYTAADLFVNPTREENFPTVNIEALACGTPVISYQTGGSAEIFDESCGVSVPKDDFERLYTEILRVSKEIPFTSEACIARSQKYDKAECFEKYAALYMNLES